MLAAYERAPSPARRRVDHASRSETTRRNGLPLRNSGTEGQVLKRIRQRLPQLVDYWQPLTDNWVELAYAHRLPEGEAVHSLCRQYRQVFAGGEQEFSGSLRAAGEGRA